MPLFVLNRNHVLATNKGHRIVFKKDEPVHVPPIVVPDAVAIGATPADGSEPNILPPEKLDHNPTAEDPTLRREALLGAVKRLVARNDPDDFGADNAPKPDALRAIVAFKVDVRERNEIWQMYHDLVAEGAL